MARVVQRGTSPPYLLIVFVIIAVMATGLAVLFYTRGTDTTEQAQSLQKQLATAKKESQDKAGEVRLLTEKITGNQSSSAAPALLAADKALETPRAEDFRAQGLVATVAGLAERYDALVAAKAKTDADFASLSDRMAKADQAHQATVATMAQQIKAASDAKTAEEQRAQREIQAKADQLARVEGQAKADLAAAAAQVASFDKERKTLQDRIASLDMELAKLRAEIARNRPLSAAGELAAREPDGTIRRVVPNDTICFIGLGAKDGITPGLPFGVYDADQVITAESEPKASIIVLKVNQHTSECRIERSSTANPVREGDKIINVVYDPSRTYTFAIEGEFDLYGEGRIDPLANQRIRSLIESWGGKVVDDVAISTDFVVMGEVPVRPQEPGADASPQDLAQYQEQIKRYSRYNDIKNEAVKLQIPVLNANRFVALSGYVPKRKPGP